MTGNRRPARGPGLRTRLAIAFTLAAAVPLVAVDLLASRGVRREFERRTEGEFSRLRALSERELRREGEKVASQVSQAAQAFALRDAVLAYAAAPRGAAQAAVIAALAAQAERAGLPLLSLYREDGRLVGSAEEPARFDLIDPAALREAREGGGRARLSLVEGLEVRGLALRASAPIEAVGGRFWLLGGRLLDLEFLRELPVPEGMALLVVGPDGVHAGPTAAGREAAAALGASAGGEEDGVRKALEQAGWRVARAEMKGLSQGVPAAFLLATSLAPLRQTLEDIQRSFLLFLGLGVLLASVLGWVLGRSLTDPVAQLVAGFERVAAGDLDVRLAIARGDELGRLVEAFHAMTRDLAESRESLRQAERIAAWREIARQLAHEIKNPLSPIALSMETLRRARKSGRGDFDALLEECTGTVLEEVDRLRRIVQEFSDFARLPRPRAVEASFHDVVRGVVGLHAGAAGERILLDLEPGEGRFVFDPDQMNRLLVNLVKNALEASPEGGMVRIRTRREADRFVLWVEDDGPGVDAAVAERLFEPYLTTKAGGTGLGLAIVRRIAEEHGGSVRLENPGEPRARFRIELPRARPQAA